MCRLYAEDPDPWNAALRDAGLAPRARRWSDEAIRAALAGFWAAEGRAPRRRDLAGAAWNGPSAQTLRRRYGCLAAAWTALRRPRRPSAGAARATPAGRLHSATAP